MFAGKSRSANRPRNEQAKFLNSQNGRPVGIENADKLQDEERREPISERTPGQHHMTKCVENLFAVNKSADPIPLAGMVGAADWVYQKILSSARYPIIGENELNADARPYHEQQGKVRYSPVKQSSKASRIQPQNINYSLSHSGPRTRGLSEGLRARLKVRWIGVLQRRMGRGVVSVPRDVELGCERGPGPGRRRNRTGRERQRQERNPKDRKNHQSSAAFVRMPRGLQCSENTLLMRTWRGKMITALTLMGPASGPAAESGRILNQPAAPNLASVTSDSDACMAMTHGAHCPSHRRAGVTSNIERRGNDEAQRADTERAGCSGRWLMSTLRGRGSKKIGSEGRWTTVEGRTDSRVPVHDVKVQRRVQHEEQVVSAGNGKRPLVLPLQGFSEELC
ncbi:hypothetical protein B0H13DRAFT_1855386 [Mycena leptocephala]|nr:hypothetical protein B0H13DRAFT_1855386 [Mycena leptocephala]